MTPCPGNEDEVDDQSNNDDEVKPEEDTSSEIEGEQASSPPSSTTAPSGTLKAHFINVGQGDAILIQTPSQNILIDAGDRGNTVVNYLKAQGVNSLDLVIGTHPHADHIGGLINVFQSIPVKEVISFTMKDKKATIR